MLRYRIGFESPTAKADCTERNPGWFPIVDMQSFAAFGVVIALVENKDDAETICNLMNAIAGVHK